MQGDDIMKYIDMLINQATEELKALSAEFAEIVTDTTVTGFAEKDGLMEEINKKALAVSFRISMLSAIGGKVEEEQ